MLPIRRSPPVAHRRLSRTRALALAVVALGNAGVFAHAGAPGSGRIVRLVTINGALPANPLAEMIVPPPSIVRGDPETLKVVVFSYPGPVTGTQP